MYMWTSYVIIFGHIKTSFMELASGVINSIGKLGIPRTKWIFFELGRSTMNVGFSSTQLWLITKGYRRLMKIIDLRRIWYMTSGDSLGFTQTTWEFNPEKWMGSFINLVNIHFPMTPTCGLPGLSPLKLSNWIMGFRPGRRWVRLLIISPLFSFGVGRRVNPQGFFFVGGCRCDIWIPRKNPSKFLEKRPWSPRFGIWMSVFYHFSMASFFGGAHDSGIWSTPGSSSRSGASGGLRCHQLRWDKPGKTIGKP